jgi:peptidoglycan/xylan/chitin deacetylase (PgdA/CDA1 family)
VSLFKDGKKAALLLAFDDNAPTHLDFVIPELENRRMVGTFYVVPGSELFQEQRALWQAAAQSPFVQLANHTYTHRGATTIEELEPELAQCNDALYALYPEREVPHLTAFARPGGVPWTVAEEDVEALLQKFHLVRRPFFFHPAKPEKTAQQITAEMIAAVDDVLEKGDITQIGFHGVGGDWHSTPRESFLALLDKLEKHRDALWICDPVTLHQHTVAGQSSTVDFDRT